MTKRDAHGNHIHTCTLGGRKHEGTVPLFAGEEYACLPCLVRVAQEFVTKRNMRNAIKEIYSDERQLPRRQTGNPWPLKD